VKRHAKHQPERHNGLIQILELFALCISDVLLTVNYVETRDTEGALARSFTALC